MKLVDLRSDTVTRPSAAMRKVMAEAEVGDDVYGEDLTVNRLQRGGSAGSSGPGRNTHRAGGSDATGDHMDVNFADVKLAVDAFKRFFSV